MADIFGRNMGDYAHLRDMAKNPQILGGGDSHAALEEFLRNQANKSFERRKVHDFGSLGSKGGIAGLGDFESNAQVLGFVTNNLEATRSVAEEVLYTEMRLEEFVPVITDVDEGAPSYAYDIIDYSGVGDFLDHDGSQANSASVAIDHIPYRVFEGGMDADFTRADIRRAAFAGVPLQMEVVKAAVRGCMNHIQQVAFLGNPGKKFEGFFNHSDVEKTTNVNNFSTMTPKQQLKTLQDMVRKVVVDTQEIFGRNITGGLCLYMPHQQADLVTNTPRSDTTDTSVWEYFQTHNTWYEFTREMIELKWVLELKDIVATGEDRVVVGFNDDRIGEVAVPIMPRPVEATMEKRKVIIPFEYSMSGYNLKRGQGMHYYDNIG